MQEKSDNLDQIIAKSTEDFKNKIAQLEGVKSALLDESQRLKATVEFSIAILSRVKSLHSVIKKWLQLSIMHY